MFFPQKAIARAQKSKSSRLAGIECLYGNFTSPLDEIPATDAIYITGGIPSRLRACLHDLDTSNNPPKPTCTSLVPRRICFIEEIYNTTVVHRDQYSERAGVLGEDQGENASLSRCVLHKHPCALAILISMYNCSIAYFFNKTKAPGYEAAWTCTVRLL